MFRRGLLTALQARVSSSYGRTQIQRECLSCLYVEDALSVSRAENGLFHRHYSVDVSPVTGGSTSDTFKKGKKLLEDAKRMAEEGDVTSATKAVEAHRLLQLALTEAPHNAEIILALARLNMEQEAPGLSARNGLLLLKRAADLGVSEAQYQFACLLRDQNGANDPNSIHYLQSAARQNHGAALFLLGVALYAGGAMDRNIPEASSCFGKAAQQGYLPALTVQGALIAKGMPWITPMAEDDEDDNEEAEKEVVGTTFITSEDRDLAREHFELAAQAGDAIAEVWLQNERVAE